MNKQKKTHLIRSAHTLNPVVYIAQKGLTPAVELEIQAALTAHELMKIKFAGYDKSEKQGMAETICQNTKAELVQLIGHIGTFYRPKPIAKKKPSAKKNPTKHKPAEQRKRTRFQQDERPTAPRGGRKCVTRTGNLPTSGNRTPRRRQSSPRSA